MKITRHRIKYGIEYLYFSTWEDKDWGTCHIEKDEFMATYNHFCPGPGYDGFSIINLDLMQGEGLFGAFPEQVYRGPHTEGLTLIEEIEKYHGRKFTNAIEVINVS
jgi:hypothetical protein